MGQNTSHRIKSISLLLVFILLKIGVAHSLSHAFSHDDFDDCEQCVLIVDSNNTKTFNGHLYPYSSDVIKIDVLPKPFTLLYKNPLFREHDYVFFFNKPPPFL